MKCFSVRAQGALRTDEKKELSSLFFLFFDLVIELPVTFLELDWKTKTCTLKALKKRLQLSERWADTKCSFFTVCAFLWKCLCPPCKEYNIYVYDNTRVCCSGCMFDSTCMPSQILVGKYYHSSLLNTNITVLDKL